MKEKENEIPTDLSMLIAHKLKMLAVHSKTSRDIQISQRIHPKCHEPFDGEKKNYVYSIA